MGCASAKPYLSLLLLVILLLLLAGVVNRVPLARGALFALLIFVE